MFISIKFTETSIDKMNETQQVVRGLKFMSKRSTIHTNTCTQMTMPQSPLCNCYRDECIEWSSSLHSLSRRSFNSFASWIYEW